VGIVVRLRGEYLRNCVSILTSTGGKLMNRMLKILCLEPSRKAAKVKDLGASRCSLLQNLTQLINI
jgi:hypothetical protein